MTTDLQEQILTELATDFEKILIEEAQQTSPTSPVDKFIAEQTAYHKVKFVEKYKDFLREGFDKAFVRPVPPTSVEVRKSNINIVSDSRE